MSQWHKQLSPKAIILGGIADIVATNIAIAPLAAYVFAQDPSALEPGYAASEAFLAALNARPALFTAALLLGSLCSVFGGWLAARLARRAPLLNGAFSAYGCLLFSAYSFVAAPSALPVWQHAVWIIVTPALGALGGVLFQRQPAPVAAPDTTNAIFTTPSRGHRVILTVNRLLLAATASLAALLTFALVVAPKDDGDDPTIVLAAVLAVTLGAVLCYLIAARTLKRGQSAHWMWHGAAGVLTAIPVGLLAIGLWMSARAG